MTAFDDSGGIARILELEKERDEYKRAWKQSNERADKWHLKWKELKYGPEPGLREPEPLISTMPNVRVEDKYYQVTVTIPDQILMAGNSGDNYDERMRSDLACQLGRALLEEGYITIETRTSQRNLYMRTQEVQYTAKIFVGKKK